MIIRTPNRERYVNISKIPLEDSRLSWRARGLHAYLMSKPDGWKVIVSHLVTQGTDGRSAVLGALKELEECGYIIRHRRDRVGGRFDGMNCDVVEEPVDRNLKLLVAPSPKIERGTVFDLPPTVNRTVVNNEVLNNDLMKKEAKSHQFVSEPVDISEVRNRVKEIKSLFGEFA